MTTYCLLSVILVLLSTGGSQSQDYDCGQIRLPPADLQDQDLYLSGGRDATPGLFPWTLALEKAEDAGYDLQCGAVLIDPLWALTSARCVADNPGADVYRVVAGQLSRTEPSGLEQYINLASITMHPDFDPTSESYNNDLAVLELSEPAEIGDESRPIYPICLPPSNETRYWENPNCAITGYGFNNETSEYPSMLQEAWMDVIRPANCELWWGEEGVIIDTHQCAYDQVNREVSLCEKDLGGPLSCMVDARFDLAGVGSFYRDECNPRFPSIFTSIPQYLDWVVELTGVSPRPEGEAEIMY